MSEASKYYSRAPEFIAEDLQKQLAALAAELERVKGEVQTLRDAASRDWPMTWNGKPFGEWDQGDIANFVAGYWRHHIATASADALREARERVLNVPISLSVDVFRDDVLAAIGGAE